MYIDPIVIVAAMPLLLILYALRAGKHLHLSYWFPGGQVQATVGASTSNQSLRVQSSFGESRREVEITAGNRYRVEPLNPKKRKHRGRYVVVRSLDASERMAHVTFEETERLGKVSMEDLVPAPD